MDTSDRAGREGVLDDNVVRLPRDWLGPREDLIPFGTSSEPGPSGGPAPTADDFWGESSAAVQDAVQRDAVQRPPTPARSAGRPRSLARGRALLVGLVAVAAAAVLAVLLVGGGGQGVPRRSSSSSLSASRVSPSVFVGAAAHRAVASSARALRPLHYAPPPANARETQSHLPEPCGRHGGGDAAGHNPGLAGRVIFVVAVDEQPRYHFVVIERRRIDRRQQPDVERQRRNRPSLQHRIRPELRQRIRQELGQPTRHRSRRRPRARQLP